MQRSIITILFLIVSSYIFFHVLTIGVEASICPRAACSNKCDLTGTECAPDPVTLQPRACTVDEQGWWCVQKESCDPAYPGGVKQRAYLCDGFHWIDKGLETPDSDCAGFCFNEGGITPTPYPTGAQACKDRPFVVRFTSTRKMGPGEKILCEVKQTNTLCEPCTGLSKNTQCEIKQTFDTCTTAGNDCLCKYGGFSYECTLNGITIPGNGSGALPPSVIVNAQSTSITFDPQSGGALDCQIGKSCSACNGNNASCFPDCGGGTCVSGQCTTCPANPQACQIGQSCAGACSGNTEACYPGCNGGFCNANNKCDTCSEAGVTPIIPTLVQQKSVITIAPTFKPAGNTAPPAPQKTQRWICLETQPCSDPFSECSGRGEPMHRASISTGKAAQAVANSNSYIFECLVDSTNGIQCTTGNGSLDKQLLQTDVLSKLSASYGYVFKGFFKGDGVTPEQNPVRSGSKGEIGVHEWESNSISTGHVFFAMNQISPNDYTGTDPSSKQGTFNLEGIPYSGCIMLTYDPYGRVFDSKTLEPVSGAKVTLLKKNSDGRFVKVTGADSIGGIANPVFTGKDGAFSFRVPDGTYKLTVEAKGYRFPADKNGLNAKYSEIYSNIYSGEAIIQKGKIVHHDIPLVPEDERTSQKQSAGTKPQITALNQMVDAASQTIRIEGRTTHPSTRIRIYGAKPAGSKFTRTRLIAEKSADKWGKFSVAIKESMLQKNEVAGEIKLIKNDGIFNTDSNTKQTEASRIINFFIPSFIRNVIGAEYEETVQTVLLDPVVAQLEGFAKNDRGVAIPNTKVSIYLPFSREPVANVKTDENGYFSFPRGYLPDIPFHLEYKTATGAEIKKTVSQFLLENSR